MVGEGLGLVAAHLHDAAYADLEVAGLQTDKLDRASVRKVPNDLAALARVNGDGVGVGVLHPGMPAYLLSVGNEIDQRVQCHLVPHLPAVDNFEADSLTALNDDPCGYETHSIGRVDAHHAYDTGGAAGFIGCSIAVVVPANVTAGGVDDDDY